MKTVFTSGQVAKICKVAPRTVSKWFDSGRLQGYRIPGSQDRRIPRDSLVAFLKKHNMPLGELEGSSPATIFFVTQDEKVSGLVRERTDSEEGLQVIVERSGFEVGLKIKEVNLRGLLIDFSIGIKEACAMYDKLRSDFCRNKVILIAIWARDDEKKAIEHMSFDEVFRKPLDMELVVARFQSLLAAAEDTI